MDVSRPPLISVFHRSRRRRTAWPLVAFCCWAAVAGGVLQPAVSRADDTIRRVQEELRKRNLYFGDIDGQHSRGIVGAIRRYQERKGFAATGEPDEVTLRSLSIPVAAPGEALAADPWPEAPVLKSDLGRRHPPPQGVVVTADDPEIVPAAAAGSPPALSPAQGGSGGPSVVMARGTPQMAEANPAATPLPSPAVENLPPGEARLTPEAARAFLEAYLRDGSTNNVEAEMVHYADEVNYFNDGVVSRAFIARDVRRYYKRWPERRFEIIGPMAIAEGARPGESTVHFQLRCSYRGTVKGRPVSTEVRTGNVFTLQGSRPEEVRIVGMKEERLRS